MRTTCISVLCLFMAGCASTTIDFADPPRSKIDIESKKYVFPVAVRLRQKTRLATAIGGYDIEIDLPDSTSQGEVLESYGKLYVYKTPLTDVDRLARNFFRIPEEKMEALKKGAAVTIEGYSADGHKLLYRAVIGLKKEEETQYPVY